MSTANDRPRSVRACLGFTLIEVLVVIAVIGLLVALQVRGAGGAGLRHRRRNRRAPARSRRLKGIAASCV